MPNVIIACGNLLHEHDDSKTAIDRVTRLAKEARALWAATT